MPRLSPLAIEVVSALDQRYHLCVVIVQLDFELPDLVIGLVDFLINDLDLDVILALFLGYLLRLILLGKQAHSRGLHFLFEFMDTLLHFNFFDEVVCKVILGFLQLSHVHMWISIY